MNIENTEIQAMAQAVIEAAAEARYEQIKRDMPQALAEERAERAGFEQRLHARWAPALDLYEMIVVLSLKAGEAFNGQHRPQAASEQDYVFEVLTRIHARACQTASEVGALLRSGHASGALSRQRTLHELAVVAYVIKEHGQDVAERYLLHEVVESVKIVEEHQKHAARLGKESYKPEVLAELRRKRDALCQRFGSSYKNQYGWAASALGNKNPGIVDLEAAAKLDHHRPYYRMASHGVHPNPKGLFFNIGYLNPRALMPAGPSNIGMLEPGFGTLNSLAQCTYVLLNLSLDMENVATMQAISRLVTEAGEAFRKVHNDLINEEAVLARERREAGENGAGS